MTTDDIINTDLSWAEEDPSQHMGGRNSARRVKNAGSKVAFFKTSPAYVLGNEVLACILAERLNLPYAPIKFAKLFDDGTGPKSGILSFRLSGIETIDWPLIPSVVTSNPKTYIMNLIDLPKIAVFDVWSYNTDRNQGNIVISRKEEWQNKFLLYMIDHEECFYGLSPQFNRHVGDGQWDDANKFLSIQILKDALKLSEVEDFVSEIEQFTSEELKQLIGLIPGEYYNDEQAATVHNLLITRRDNLRQMIQNWCTQQGKL